MKNWLIIFALLPALQTFSQDSTRQEPFTYKSYASIPAFPLLALDSSKFSSISVVNKKESLIIMYFSPTCSHCQHQAEEMTSHMKELKNVKILMVSAYPLEEMRQFNNDYGLTHFSNIKLGNDPEFSMGRFFDLKSLPGIFIYGKDGKLKKWFETNVKIEDLVAAL
jgi:peroxiredoxin